MYCANRWPVIESRVRGGLFGVTPLPLRDSLIDFDSGHGTYEKWRTLGISQESATFPLMNPQTSPKEARRYPLRSLAFRDYEGPKA